VSVLREAVEGLEDKVSGKFWNKLQKYGKKMPKFEGVKRGFTQKIMRQRSKVKIERPGETVVNEETDLEAVDYPNSEPEPSSDVLEVWFSGCHSGEHKHIFLIFS
jgi:hypothetical protein